MSSGLISLKVYNNMSIILFCSVRARRKGENLRKNKKTDKEINAATVCASDKGRVWITSSSDSAIPAQAAMAAEIPAGLAH